MKTHESSTPEKDILHSLKRMFQWMGRRWPLLILSFGFLYLVSYIRTTIPLFGQHIIDVILKRGNQGSKLPDYLSGLINGDTAFQQLLLAAGLLLLINVIRSLSIFLRRLVTGYFAESTAYDLRNNLYRKLQNLGYNYHAHAETGDIIQRCTTDVDTYKRFIGDQIIEVLRLAMLVGLSIWQMSKLNTTMMFITLALTPVIFAIAFVYFHNVERLFHVIEDNEAKMTTHVQENVSGSRVVKAFANEKYEVNKFDNLNRRFTDSDFRLVKRMSLFWSTTDFLSFVQFCVTAVVGIIFTIQGRITLGMYTAFLVYTSNIIFPMRQLGRLVGDFSKSTVAVSRLDSILSESDEYDIANGREIPDIDGRVRFEHVSFKFPDAKEEHLKDINFNVNKGETVAIVGKTGSGKTTLMNLLIRLHEYQRGRIMLGEHEIKDIEKHHLRKHIGIILQEPFLYSRSVLENIGISDREYPEDRIYQVAKIAHVHEDIVNFEKGYKTMVGERGVTLSGGQKQRVAIARMLLKPKPILIFDDSLSAVDTETDIQIRQALQKEWRDSTVFIITHRITTAMEADRILVIEDGKIVEEGTHEDLLKNKKMYHNIWSIQSRIDYQVGEG